MQKTILIELLKQVFTHVVPKQVVVEDEKEMELHNQYVYNPQLFSIFYFDQMHLHQLLFQQTNQNK